MSDSLSDKTISSGQLSTFCCSLPERNPNFVGRKALMAKVEEFIQTHSSGYLVIVGGMGTGKSAFMARLIHRERDRGEEPVYHIIDYHPAPTGDQEAIAACLCSRLKDKYNLQEPEVGLDRTLRYLSANDFRRRERPEVLFIDAADQAEASRENPLLPGALRDLPPGVVCVISSRTDVAWLRPRRNVARLDMDEYVDDRADVKEYLEKVSRLPRSFIGKIVSQQAPPVFLTVTENLRKLEDPYESAGIKERLLDDPSLWLVPPEDMVDTEAGRIEVLAEGEGIGPEKFWKTLGLLAVAREDLSQEQLSDLDLWEENVTGKVLRTAANFLQPQSITWSPHEPYRFQHPGYHRAVLEHLADRDIEECHGRIAEGCSKCWSDPNSPAHPYSLHNLPSHLQSGGMWDKLCDALTDFGYLHAKIELDTVFHLLRDFYSALSSEPSLPADHPMRDQINALYRAIDASSHVLKDDPSMLIQQVYNQVGVDWDTETRLGQELRKAMESNQHTWLRLLNPSARSRSPLLRILKGHEGWVNSVAFSPTGDTIASGSDDKTVILWDARTGEQIRTLAGHESSVRSVAFSPTGDTIASGSDDNTVILWDARTGEQIRTLAGHESSVLSVAFSPTGDTIASGSDDKTVILWDTRTGDMIKTLVGHESFVLAVSFSPDGYTLASGSYNTVILWNARTGERIRTLGGDESWVNSVSFSPDGDMLASGSDNNIVILWNARTGERIRILAGHEYMVRSVSFSPDGDMLASGSLDNTVILWDARTGERIRALAGHKDFVNSIALSPDGDMLASGGADNTVILWDARTGGRIRTLAGHADWVFSISFSPDGDMVASGSYEVILWDARTGGRIRTLEGHESRVRSVSFSPDGYTLASGSHDKTVILWDARTGERIRTLEGHADWVSSVSFSPDGYTLASGSVDRTVILWDARTGERLRTLVGHEYEVDYVSFSPDGYTLASGSYEVILWDARTGERIRALVGHKYGVSSVSFSPDGYTLASGSYDHTVILWDARTGEKLAWMPCRCPVLTCQFGADHRLYAADDGGGSGHIPNIYIMEVMKPGAKITDRKVKGSEEMAEFDVFLAHNSVDRDKVEAIGEALKQKGLTPWLDKEQIPPGRWFQDVIQQAIATVKSAAIFIGEQGLGRWEALELRSFISQCVERGIPVIPALLPGVEQIPDDLLFLKELNWVRFTTLDNAEAIGNLYWGITGERL